MKTLALVSLLVVSTFALPSTKNGRIWNGETASPGQAPYLIGILRYEEEGTEQPVNVCGGAIINEWWVITGAHCLDIYKVELRQHQVFFERRLEIVAGQHFLSIGNRTGNEQIREPRTEILHPSFTGRPGSFDMALVQLDRPFEFNEFVRPIALPAQANMPLQSGTVRTFGWGSITGQAPHAQTEELQTAELSIMASDVCQEVYRVLAPGLPLSSNALCTSMLPRGGNICNGDSGGPAVFTQENGEEVLIGVLSYGLSPCFNSDIPSVWSGIAPNRDWIEEQMAANPNPAAD